MNDAEYIAALNTKISLQADELRKQDAQLARVTAELADLRLRLDLIHGIFHKEIGFIEDHIKESLERRARFVTDSAVKGADGGAGENDK